MTKVDQRKTSTKAELIAALVRMPDDAIVHVVEGRAPVLLGRFKVECYDIGEPANAWEKYTVKKPFVVIDARRPIPRLPTSRP
jgi:hypothetical protein